MGTVIAIACVVSILLNYSLLNSIFYVINKKWCYYLNRQICKQAPKRILACLRIYANFRFKPDYATLKDLPPQYLIISNHQSLLDILIFYAFLDADRVKFIAKSGLGGHVPLISVMLKTDGHCMIERTGHTTQVMTLLDKFSDRILQNNWLPLIFPEGTRSKTGKLGTFHAAGFRRLASNLNLPVVVFALDGGVQIGTLKKSLTNLKDEIYKIKALKVYPPPVTKQEQVAVLEDSKAVIQKQLDEWQRS